MLKNIPAIILPVLLKILAEMEHSDRILITDAPLTSSNKSTDPAPAGSLYRDDEGKLYVKLRGYYCTNQPSGAGNSFWALIGEAE